LALTGLTASLWRSSLSPRQSGIVGVVLIALAIYVAFAAELEDAQGRTVLPLGRRMRGSLAVVGSLEEQMKHAPNEAGVRQTL